MILCRFDLVQGASKDQDATAHVEGVLPAVPVCGETINLHGHPYVVIDRGWSWGGDMLHCYLRIVSHHGTVPNPESPQP